MRTQKRFAGKTPEEAKLKAAEYLCENGLTKISSIGSPRFIGYSGDIGHQGLRAGDEVWECQASIWRK